MSPVTGKRIAIANRGEIAVRIAATCRRMGAIPVLLLGEPDLGGYAARQVGLFEPIGEAGSELDVGRVIAAARRVKAELLHPGYGFLSERAELADACAAAGVTFVGPSAETLRLCGDKLATRDAAARAEVEVLPASPPLADDPAAWPTAAREVGYPLLVKPAGAGGGRGLRHVGEEAGLTEAIRASRREADPTGGPATVYLEHELIDPRHVEVQLAADGQRSMAIGDRDCSIQRRHQKVIEEAPAPNLRPEIRALLHEYACRIADETRLRGIATCEFLIGADGRIAFLEVNPRIQVEHPVTEQVTGIDLVEWQLVIASGGTLPLASPPEPRGHSIEARVYAEDPWAGHFPSPGRLTTVSWPVRPETRIDAGYESGDAVPGDYDSMIAKVIVRGSDRQSALAELRGALLETVISGTRTNVPWLMNLLDNGSVRTGYATTRTASEVDPQMPERALAPIAAVAHLLDYHRPDSQDAWAALGHWRMSGQSTITIHGDDWEQRVRAKQTKLGWQAIVDQTADTIRWSRDAAGVLTITSGDSVERYAVSERDESIEVTGNGGRWWMRPGPRPLNAVASQRRSSNGRVTAPLPATVMSVHVEAGDRVEAGQPLVTLFAMKMELVCEAPAGGTVESISIHAGDLVAADQLLVVVRPIAPKDPDSA